MIKFTLLFLSILIFSQNGFSKNEKITLKAAETTGKPYLEYYAGACDDETWATIKKWAARSKFADATVPAVTYSVEGNSVKASNGMKLFMKDGKNTLVGNNFEYSGSICEIAAAAIKKNTSAPSALYNFFVPNAVAEELKTEKSPGSELGEVIGTAAGGAIAGGISGSVLPAVGTASGALVGWIAGVAYGVYKVTTDDSIAKNTKTLQNEIVAALKGAKVKSCSGVSIEIESSQTYPKKKITIVRGEGTVRIDQERGPTGYLPASNGVARSIVSEFGSCNNSTDAARINLANEMAADKQNKRCTDLFTLPKAGSRSKRTS